MTLLGTSTYSCLWEEDWHRVEVKTSVNTTHDAPLKKKNSFSPNTVHITKVRSGLGRKCRVDKNVACILTLGGPQHTISVTKAYPRKHDLKTWVLT